MSGDESDLQKSKPHGKSPTKSPRRIIVLDDIPVVAVPTQIRKSKSAQCSGTAPDSDSGDSIKLFSDSRISVKSKTKTSGKETLVRKRKLSAKLSRLKRELSVSDSDGKRSVKDLTRKKLPKKYANISSKIDTGAKSVIRSSDMDPDKNETFQSAYATQPAIRTYQAESERVPDEPATVDRGSLHPPSPLEVNVQVTAMDTGAVSSDDEERPRTTSQTFVTPRKTSKFATLLQKRVSPQPVTTTNKFQPLIAHTQTETEQEISAKTQASLRKPATAGRATQPKSPSKPKNPPPLVLKGLPTSHKDMMAELKTHLKKTFSVKYTANNTIVYPSDTADYQALKTALTDVEYEFHTYTPSEQKRHAFVLVGLQGDPAVSDIKDELEEQHGIHVHNIFRMRTQRAPLYLLVVANDITLKTLQSTVRTLLYTRIRWERRRNERLLSQCRRCQAWGHATSNCFRAPKCVKCGQGHYTRDCNMAPDTDPTCANCNGKHTASSTTCPIYVKRTEALQQPQPTAPQQTKYVDAPPPATNPWKKNQPAQPTTQVQQEESRQPSATPTPASRPIAQTSSVDEFTQLMSELNTLNSLIDLSQAIKAIAVLNKMLLQAKSNLQAIEVLQLFAQTELPKFSILRSLP